MEHIETWLEHIINLTEDFIRFGDMEHGFLDVFTCGGIGILDKKFWSFK